LLLFSSCSTALRASHSFPTRRSSDLRGHPDHHRRRRGSGDAVLIRSRAMSAIETMFLEERRYPPPADFAAQANAQAAIYDEGFEAFWVREGRERLTWFEPFTELYEWEPPYAKFFLGGKLNVCF